MLRFTNEHGWSLAALGLVLLVYLFALRVIPQEVFWSPDEGIKFIMLRTLSGDPRSPYVLPYQGASLDPEFQFYPSIEPLPHLDDEYPFPLPDGSIHFAWPIWFPLLARLPYAAAGSAGLYLIPLVSSWLTSVVAWRITYRVRPRLAPAAVLLVGLGTPMFFYSLTFWEHTAATLLVLSALWILAASPPDRVLPLILASPLLIIATILRFEMLAFALALVLAWLAAGWVMRKTHRAAAPPLGSTHRASGPGSLPALVAQARRHPLRGVAYLVAMLLLVFLLTHYSDLIAPRHLSNITTYAQTFVDNAERLKSSPAFLLRTIANVPNLMINYAGGDGPAMDTAWLWVGLLAIGLGALSAFAVSPRLEAGGVVASLFILLLLSLVALTSSQSYRSLHGIFLSAPFGIMAVYVVPYAWRRQEQALLLMALTTFLYLFVGTAMVLLTKTSWDGSPMTGLEWGPRYLLPLYPLLAILSLVSLGIYSASNRPVGLKRAVIGMVVLMMTLGVQYEVRGLWTLDHDKRMIAEWARALETQRPEPVVTDLWWFPANVAPYFTTHEVYVVHQNMAEWLSLAAAHQVATFTFVSQTAWRPAGDDASAVRFIPNSQREVNGITLTRWRISRSPDDLRSEQ